MNEDYSPPEVQTAERTTELLNRVENDLAERGISNIEVGTASTAERPVLLMMNEQAKNVETRRQDVGQVLETLGLERGASVKVQTRRIDFKEDVSLGPLAKEFPSRALDQHLEIYNFMSVGSEIPGSVPLVLYSHGGSIREDFNATSPFLAAIEAYSQNAGKGMIITAVDHRGSATQEEKANYSLEDRVADLEVALPTVIREIIPEYAVRGVTWNGEIIIMGNSMGGHVACLASEVVRPTALILDAPAAYPLEAQNVPFGPKFTAALRSAPDAWTNSPAFNAYKNYLAMGGSALVVEALEDNVIPPAVTQTYLRAVPENFRRIAEEAEPMRHYSLAYVTYPTGHEDIHQDEVKALVGFATESKTRP